MGRAGAAMSRTLDLSSTAAPGLNSAAVHTIPKLSGGDRTPHGRSPPARRPGTAAPRTETNTKKPRHLTEDRPVVAADSKPDPKLRGYHHSRCLDRDRSHGAVLDHRALHRARRRLVEPCRYALNSLTSGAPNQSLLILKKTFSVVSDGSGYVCASRRALSLCRSGSGP